MRNPIQDANEGAVTQNAPVKQHVQRAVAIDQQGSQELSARNQNIMQMSSKLGEAVGAFVDTKTEDRMKAKYADAFLAQGTKKGLSEADKGLKRSGAAELLFGQNPSYQGKLDAATGNASRELFIAEAGTQAAGEVAHLSPADYGARLVN